MAAITREEASDLALKVIALISGSGAFVFSVLGGDDNSRRATYIVYGVACLMVTTVAAYIESGISRRSLLAQEILAKEQARTQEEIVNSISAAAIHLARIGGLRSGPSQDLDRAHGQLDQAICVAAASIHPGSRAAFYAWKSGRFQREGVWAGAPKVIDEISAGDFGFPVLRHTLRTGGVFKRENVKSYFDGPPTSAAKADNAIVVIPVRAGSHQLGILAMDAKMESWVPLIDFPVDGYSDSDVRHLLVLADLLASGLK